MNRTPLDRNVPAVVLSSPLPLVRLEISLLEKFTRCRLARVPEALFVSLGEVEVVTTGRWLTLLALYIAMVNESRRNQMMIIVILLAMGALHAVVGLIQTMISGPIGEPRAYGFAGNPIHWACTWARTSRELSEPSSWCVTVTALVFLSSRC